jgi:hypothetical protein
MNHVGAYFNDAHRAFAPRWCIFIFSVLVLSWNPAEVGGYNEVRRSVFQPRRASQSPAGAPTTLCRHKPESVIVGNTLPAEVLVPQVPFFKGGDAVFRKLTAVL